MRQNLFVFFGLAACFSLGLWIAVYMNSPVAAQQVTPTYFTAIAGPFDFLYAYPNQIGWSSAEDKRGDPYIKGYKVDVDRNRADCLHWTAVGAIPAAQLSIDPACSGGTRLGTGIYWFDAPPMPTLMPTATGFLVSPSPSPSASVSATLTLTPTPSPFPISKTSTPTPAPMGTPIIIPYQPRPWVGQFSINGMCTFGGELAYIYNIKRDDKGNLIAFDKVICTSREEFAKTQGFEAIATLDARVPITTGWTFLNTPTPTATAKP